MIECSPHDFRSSQPGFFTHHYQLSKLRFRYLNINLLHRLCPYHLSTEWVIPGSVFIPWNSILGEDQSVSW